MREQEQYATALTDQRHLAEILHWKQLHEQVSVERDRVWVEIVAWNLVSAYSHAVPQNARRRNESRKRARRAVVGRQSPVERGEKENPGYMMCHLMFAH